jgi:uncharacterized protein (TIGR03545 family)
VKRWIRWQGVAAFLGVVIVFSVFWFLLIDGIVERVIEKSATRAIGARVELESADLSLFPLGLKLNGLRIANPDEPMKNAVEVARINLALETLNLLRRKIIIQEMNLDGVQIGTPRKTSGAVVSRPSAPTPVSKKTPKKGLCAAIELPAFEMPDVSEILKKEKLESVDLATSLLRDIQDEKARWERRLQDLPDKKKFDEYRDRIEQLKSKRKGPLGGLLSEVGDVAVLQKDLQRDLDHIESAHREFNAQKASLTMRLDQATKSPLKDIRRLTEKYSLSPQGLANLSRLLLGYKLCGWTEKGVAWYGKLKPLLERVKRKEKGHEVVKPIRARGLDIRFKEKAPLPDFLIRQMKADLVLQKGDLKGTIANVTPDQDILGIPLTFEFSGENMEGFKDSRINGVLDHIVPSRSKDAVNLAITGYEVRDLTLSDKPEWPVALKNGNAALDMHVLLRGENVTANLSASLKSVQISAGVKEGVSLMAKAIGAALSDVSQFTVSAELTGTLEDYDIELTSNLDPLLKSAASKTVGREAARLEGELKQAILGKVGGSLEQAKGSLGGFDAIGSELTDRLNLGNRLLKSLNLPF